MLNFVWRLIAEEVTLARCDSLSKCPLRAARLEGRSRS
jgi:hypothetical protein